MTRDTIVPAISPQLEDLPERRAAVVRFEGSAEELQSLFNEAFALTATAIQGAGATVTGEPFGRYVEFGERIVADAGFPFEGDVAPAGRVQITTLPGGRAVTLVHVGPYETVGEAWALGQAWLQERGLTVAGAPWESYLTDPAEPGPPVTRVVWPVR